jgi:predicted dehydrogenase
MQKLKFAVVGCGHIGKKHLDVIIKEPHAKLVGLCDINEDELQKCAKQHSDVAVFNDFKAMLLETNADVISVCTPHGLHAEMSIQAARASKHILVEKPMALTSKQSQQMIDVTNKEGVRLFVVKQNRYNKPIKPYKKIG